MTEQALQLPSNSRFGWFFAAVFAASGAYFKWKLASAWDMPMFFLAFAFAALALVAPKLLAPLNRLWFQLGMVLGKIVSPVVLGMMFFVLITPVAIFMRLMGRDVLRMKQRKVSSYWIKREPAGLEPESFRNQF